MACCRKAKALKAKRLKDAAQMRMLAKNPDWNVLRKRLTGTWIKQPEWGCGQLKEYLGNKISTASLEKLQIVNDYFQNRWFRDERVKHSCIQTLKSQILMELKKRQAGTK